MFSGFCVSRLNELEILVHRQGTFMGIFCVLNVMFSLVAAIGNLLLIRVLWMASSTPANIGKFFLSLAFSDLAVGLFSQLFFGIVIAIMLNVTGALPFCPTILNVTYFFIFLPTSASFLNITAIAVDRVLTVWLHLRYQELVTPNRVIMVLASLWTTISVAASTILLLPKDFRIVLTVFNLAGFLLITVAYIRLHKAVSYHQNQIQSQLQLQNTQAVELLREKKACYNALFVYSVFLACFTPLLASTILLTFDDMRISFLLYDHTAIILALLNSSLNPLVYCWRCREIRSNVEGAVKKIFCVN